MAPVQARLGRWGYRAALLALRAWWALRRPRTDGVRCVLRHGDAFVLVRHTYGDRDWMLPGGRIRRGESALATAEREMRQELGVTATGWHELGYVAPRRGFRRTSRDQPFRRHGTYYVTAETSARELAPRAMELGDAGWFTVAELPPGCSEALRLPLARAWLP
jgi:8-oxo-dGTP pyrophosphatase MutT (NUDIX family)